MKMMATGVPEVEVQNLTVIDAQDGNKVAQIASLIEQLRQTTGVDVTQVANNLVNNDADKAIKKLEAEKDLP